MSRIDDLIAAHCPGGVEFKTLQEIFVTKNGYTPSKANPVYWTNGTIPWFRMEDIRENGRILSPDIARVSRFEPFSPPAVA
ncbi:MAG: restriction endonuclease subunit S, partial [Candidatus Poribacteria bacterium]|nr:restriction endonuclease subunit S [Candidatus Poribacteria bacterium]